MDRQTLNKIVDAMPVGEQRAVLRILSYAIGRENAISREKLLMELGYTGYTMGDRPMRALINQLRKEGHPICSIGGENGGYYMARNWSELNDYLEREVHSRAMDLLEQEKALRQEGRRLWGAETLQERLF